MTLQTEIDLCIEQNVHNRTADEIRSYANNWTLGPDDHPLINASILFDEEGHGVGGAGAVVTADMDLCSDEDEGFQKDVEATKDGNGEESVTVEAPAAEQMVSVMIGDSYIDFCKRKSRF